MQNALVKKMEIHFEWMLSKIKMENIRVAFDILDDSRKVEPGRTYLECYMIFEVKIDLRRKATYV